MSGRKRAVIYQDEYNKLLNDLKASAQEITRLKAVQSRADKTAADLAGAQKRMADLEKKEKDMQALIDRLRSSAVSTDGQVASLKQALVNQADAQRRAMQDQDRKHAAQIKDINRAFDKRLNDAVLDINGTIQATKADIEGQIQQVRAQTNQQIASVTRNLNAVRDNVAQLQSALRNRADEEQRLREIAGAYQEMAQAQMEMAKGYEHGVRELKQEAADAAKKIDKAQGMMGLGPVAAAAALSDAQDALDAAVKLHENAHAAELEWSAANERAREALSMAEALVGVLSKPFEVKIQDADGTQQPVDIDVEKWSGGKVSKLQAEVAACKETILSDEANHEQLDDAAAKLNALCAQATEATSFATEAIWMSQDRWDVAGDIIDALKKQGFVVEEEDEGYECEDQRGNYIVRAKDPVGGGVVLVKVFPQVKITHREVDEQVVHVGEVENSVEIQAFGPIHNHEKLIGRILLEEVNHGDQTHPVQTLEADPLPLEHAPNRNMVLNPTTINIPQMD